MAKITDNNGKELNLIKEINIHFRIKVYSNIDKGKSINSLRGYNGLINLIGKELAQKFMINSLMSDAQKCTYKLRRGLTITFYSK